MTDQTFTKTERDLILQVLSNVSVNPSASDSLTVCAAVQSILQKLADMNAQDSFEEPSEDKDGGLLE